MRKKRYLTVVCLLFFPSFFINVEASNGGSSSVGIRFYQDPTTSVPKGVPPKADVPATSPKEPAGPPQGDQRSGGLTRTAATDSALPRIGNKSQANLSILGLVLVGFVGMVHRKRERHEAR